jgi:beta-lactamase class A
LNDKIEEKILIKKVGKQKKQTKRKEIKLKEKHLRRMKLEKRIK